MAPSRLSLVELRVAGEGVAEASVRFAPGLNLIVGASDTGKTFIFEAIDFMLGASRGLRRIPESTGYDRVFLDVDPGQGHPFTLRRAFDGGQFELTEFPAGRASPGSPPKVLKAAHSSDPDDSLSAYLLRAIGLLGREVRMNANGDKRSLSFRDVSHLTLIDEERVIQQASPVVTGQVVTKTAERNAFAYFLTGQDDSQIIPQESRAERNARLDAEERVVAEILAERTRELNAVAAVPAELPSIITRLDASIQDASRTVISTQEQIQSDSETRSALFAEQTRIRSRLLFLGEQLKRFRLLAAFYNSDRERLQGVIEASRVLHEMPEGSCPFCSQPLSAGDGKPRSHDEFEASCQKEIAKIAVLDRDLKTAIEDFQTEERTLTVRADGVSAQMREADERLQQVLAPGLGTARQELQELIRLRTQAGQGESLRANVEALQERLNRIRVARAEKVPKTTFENRATTSVATEFCKVVEDILRAWKYPDLGTVAFDTDAADLVIGGQDRTNKGKGYRAITYAAFSIGLMRYCRMKGIPHPGFVILDTPINPFRGPDSATGDDDLSDETKDAFYEHLAGDDSGDQVIIMENDRPPEAVQARASCYHFTKNTGFGRYGFLPWRPPGGDGGVPAPATPPDEEGPPANPTQPSNPNATDSPAESGPESPAQVKSKKRKREPVA